MLKRLPSARRRFSTTLSPTLAMVCVEAIEALRVVVLFVHEALKPRDQRDSADVLGGKQYFILRPQIRFFVRFLFTQ